MASLKFYLARSTAEKTALYFRFYYGAFEVVNGKKVYKPLKYYTSESIEPAYWDVKTDRAKETKKFPQYPRQRGRSSGDNARKLMKHKFFTRMVVNK